MANGGGPRLAATPFATTLYGNTHFLYYFSWTGLDDADIDCIMGGKERRKEMSYTLVVVDMQPQFESANNRRVVANVKREINRAINSGAAIIVLEYRGFGNTNRSIARMVSGYENGYFTTKSWDDGSQEVLEVCSIYGLPQFFRVIGVNYGACVKETAIGLSCSGCDVAVVKEACHQPRRWSVGCSIRYVTEVLENNNVYVEV